jgi:hypothetical protein
MSDMHFVERMEERWASISKKPIGNIDQSRLIELARKGAVAADTIASLTADNKRLRAALQWQPIETAPRDGTEVLAWGTLHEYGEDDGEQPQHLVAVWIETGWYSPTLGHWEPTHWMHLPPPPELSGDKQ